MRNALEAPGFSVRLKGDQFICTKQGIAEIVNLQPLGKGRCRCNGKSWIPACTGKTDPELIADDDKIHSNAIFTTRSVGAGRVEKSWSGLLRGTQSAADRRAPELVEVYLN